MAATLACAIVPFRFEELVCVSCQGFCYESDAEQRCFAEARERTQRDGFLDEDFRGRAPDAARKFGQCVKHPLHGAVVARRSPTSNASPRPTSCAAVLHAGIPSWPLRWPWPGSSRIELPKTLHAGARCNRARLPGAYAFAADVLTKLGADTSIETTWTITAWPLARVSSAATLRRSFKNVSSVD